MENKVFFEPVLISNVHSLAASFYDWSTESFFVDLMKHIKRYVHEVNSVIFVCVAGTLVSSVCVSVILMGVIGDMK